MEFAQTIETLKAKNAWLVRLCDEAQCHRFSVTIDHSSSFTRGAEEGDGVLIAGNDPLAAVLFARIYRIRAKLDETTFFFDGVLPINGEKLLTDLEVTVPDSKTAMSRLKWPIFEAAPKTACGYRLRCLDRAGRRLCRGAGLRAGVASIGRHQRPARSGGWSGGSVMTRSQVAPMFRVASRL